MNLDGMMIALALMVGAVGGVFLGVYNGTTVTKKALTKTECARYSPVTGAIQIKVNGNWQPFDNF